MELLIIIWLACGVICYGVMKSKGYPNNECLGNGVGGFVGGIIWLIVCLVKKPYDRARELPQQKESPNGDNAVEQLGKLAQLRDSGVITETEFAEKKRELLRKI